MKLKIRFIFIVFVFFLLFISPLISSFMPKFSHKEIFDKSIETPIDSEWYRACVKYPDLCYASSVLTDVSVIFYYTGRGKYTATHNPPFCQELIDNIAKIPGADIEEMRSCAIGGCLHQAQDIPSHSTIDGRRGLVSYAIKNSLIANEVIHVFAEQSIDNFLERKDPTLGRESEDYLNSYKKCQELFTVALMGEPSYSGMSKEELDRTFETFITEVRNSRDTGYNPGFENKSFFVTLQSIPFALLGIYIFFMLGSLLLSVLLIFKLIRGDRRFLVWLGLIIFIPLFVIMGFVFVGSLQGSAFNSFIKVIKPISELVPIGGNQGYIDAGVKNSRELLKEGPEWLIGTDASGLSTNPVLLEANSEIMIYDYLILIGLVILLGLYIWRIFKKNKIKGGFNL